MGAHNLLRTQGTASAEGSLIDAEQPGAGWSAVPPPSQACQGRHQCDPEAVLALADHMGSSCDPDLSGEPVDKLQDSRQQPGPEWQHQAPAAIEGHGIDCSNRAYEPGRGSCASSKPELDSSSGTVAKPGPEGLMTPAEAGKDWASVLQQSMQSAKNIKWTHKGLQVSWTSLVWLLSAAVAMLHASKLDSTFEMFMFLITDMSAQAHPGIACATCMFRFPWQHMHFGT